MQDEPMEKVVNGDWLIQSWRYLFGQIRITIQKVSAHPDTYDYAL